MIQFPQNTQVMVGIDAIDFRAGINRLGAVAKALFAEDPMNGILFVFRNRQQTDIKLLYYDGSGFFSGHKRLSRGKLKWWPRNERESLSISTEQLTRLLHGVDPRGNFHPDWPENRVDEQQGRFSNQYDPRGSPGAENASGARSPMPGRSRDLKQSTAVGRDAAELAIKAALEHLGMAAADIWDQN
jgi:transposase